MDLSARTSTQCFKEPFNIPNDRHIKMQFNFVENVRGLPHNVHTFNLFDWFIFNYISFYWFVLLEQ